MYTLFPLSIDFRKRHIWLAHLNAKCSSKQSFTKPLTPDRGAQSWRKARNRGGLYYLFEDVKKSRYVRRPTRTETTPPTERQDNINSIMLSATRELVFTHSGRPIPDMYHRSPRCDWEMYFAWKSHEFRWCSAK